MKMTVPTFPELEARGLAFIAGAAYVLPTLPREKVAAALTVNFHAHDWISKPVAARLQSSQRGILHRFAEVSRDGTALRYRIGIQKFSYLPVELIAPELLSLEELIDDFLDRGTPVGFVKATPRLRATGLLLGDPEQRYASILTIDTARHLLHFIDVETDPPDHARDRLTTVVPLSPVKAPALRATYRERLVPLRLNPDSQLHTHMECLLE